MPSLHPPLARPIDLRCRFYPSVLQLSVIVLCHCAVVVTAPPSPSSLLIYPSMGLSLPIPGSAPSVFTLPRLVLVISCSTHLKLHSLCTCSLYNC